MALGSAPRRQTGLYRVAGELAQGVGGNPARGSRALCLDAPGSVDGGRLALAVQRANAALPDYACVRRWLVVPPFSAQNGLATGNGRPIRRTKASGRAAHCATLSQARGEA